MEFSRRERQIMDIIYRCGEATALEVMGELENPPSYSTVRSLLAILERKGHLKHAKDGARYNYRPSRPRQEAARSAVRKMVETFFDGSAEKAVAALLDSSELRLSSEDIAKLTHMIRKARRESPQLSRSEVRKR
jgi:predicted transcriptional regulator